jgi:cytochrome c oxidase subunit 2
MASRVDALYLFLIGLTAFFTLGIAAMIAVFMIKYKRRTPNSIGARIHGGMILEITWSVIPLLIVLGVFVWAAQIFFAMARPPAETMNIYAVGKQWMWKFQHLDGQREINELHVPVGRPVKMIMTSEDVIHDLYFPEFRVKADVIPGRYSHLWFEATKAGEYHLFCAEYCGTKHSGMIGRVVVMEPDDFQAWLAGGVQEGSLASAGEKLFQDLACNTCHRPEAQGRGPVLQNLFGSQVSLQSGETAVVDEAYVRESILTPGAKVVAGYQPIMPTFQGLVSEEGLLQLIEYVKSLKTDNPVQAVRPNAGGPAPNENTPAQAPPTR